jgi:hypothetical protein
MEGEGRTSKPSIGEGSVDRERVREAFAEIARERPPRDEAALAAERSILELRYAVADHVERVSLRPAAAEIGVSPMGLRAFLQGVRPQARTERKLRDWYLRYALGKDSVSPVDVRAAIVLLVRDIDPGVRQPVIEAVLRCMESGYRDSGRDVPAWVDELRASLGAPGTAP